MHKDWLHRSTMSFVSFFSYEIQDPNVCRSSAGLDASRNVSSFIGNYSLHTTTPRPTRLPIEGGAINTKIPIWIPPYWTNPGVLRSRIYFTASLLLRVSLSSDQANSNTRRNFTYCNWQAPSASGLHNDAVSTEYVMPYTATNKMGKWSWNGKRQSWSMHVCMSMYNWCLDYLTTLFELHVLRTRNEMGRWSWMIIKYEFGRRLL
jgi:hypothetical protein